MKTSAVVFLCIAGLLAGCASQIPTTSPPPSSSSPTPASTPTRAPTAAPTVTAGLIPQPAAPAGLDVAPDSARVDLQMPTFSNPTQIDNPLFPVSAQESVLLLGTVDGLPFRTEVTLLAEHRVIDWAGQRIEALVSQYNAFIGGEIEEIAYDLYAQDDAGNVWYLGEDVFNFADGQIINTHGTWLAGRDGPAAMIMPAHPRVGQVYRPENAPPLVFEEVIVTAVDQTFDGPLGAVPGGIVVRELHLDGGTEDKQFAPSYGEFYTGSGPDVEALALAVPTDALGEAVPADLSTLTSAALALIDQARGGDWAGAAASLEAINTAWATTPERESPASLRVVMDGWLADLTAAVEGHDSAGAQQAAIDTARSGFDLHLRHRPPVEVDLARLGLWAVELRVDAAAEDLAAVNGDLFAIDYVRDRILGRVGPADMAAVDGVLEGLGVAVGDEDFEAVADRAAALREVAAAVLP